MTMLRICPHCDQFVAVNKDGALRLHRQPGSTGHAGWGRACPGSRTRESRNVPLA